MPRSMFDLFLTLSEGEEWTNEALCAQTDPDAFFPERGEPGDAAKKVCLSCSVTAECLEYALSTDERFGVWGGMSMRQRRHHKGEVESRQAG